MTMILYGFTEMGLFTTATFMKGTFLSAVTTILTSLAGAKMYKED